MKSTISGVDAPYDISDYPTVLLSVKASLVRMASTAMARGDIRYYLNGIAFEPAPKSLGGGVLIVATNGHGMIVAHDPFGHIRLPEGEKNLLLAVPPTLCAAMPKTMSAAEDSMLMTYERPQDGLGILSLVVAMFTSVGEPRTLVLDGSECKASRVKRGRSDFQIDGRFPDWKELIDPEAFELPSSGTPTAPSNTFLATRPLSALCERGNHPRQMLFYSVGKEKKQFARIVGLPNVMYLFMPLNFSEDSDGQEEWRTKWKKVFPAKRSAPAVAETKCEEATA